MGDSSLCRASSEEEGNHRDGLKIIPEASARVQDQAQAHSKQHSDTGKLICKMTTMSQAESYYPEKIARISKLSIFGDPWASTKDRNKNLIAEIMKGAVQ